MKQKFYEAPKAEVIDIGTFDSVCGLAVSGNDSGEEAAAKQHQSLDAADGEQADGSLWDE